MENDSMLSICLQKLLLFEKHGTLRAMPAGIPTNQTTKRIRFVELLNTRTQHW